MMLPEGEYPAIETAEGGLGVQEEPGTGSYTFMSSIAAAAHQASTVELEQEQERDPDALNC